MKRITKVATMTLLALSLSYSQNAVAGLDEGIAAYQNGDYHAAIKEFIPLAVRYQLVG